MSDFDPRRLGASDAGPVLLEKPRTPGDVFLRIVDGVEMPDSFAMAAGRAMEPVIRAEIEQSLGVTITKPETLLIEDWGRASPDGIIDGAGEGVEIKLAWNLDDYGTEGTDEVPRHHLLQCHAYMHIMELPRWRLVVRPIWGSRNQTYFIHRDKGLGELIWEKLRRFWGDHIVTKVPPPMRDAALLDLAWPGVYPNVKARPCVLADERVGEAMATLRMVRQKEAQVARMKEELEITIKNAIGAAAGIEHMGERITWVRPKPSKKINWERVAMQQRLYFSTFLNFQDEMEHMNEIEREATEEREGSRRFMVPRSWTAAPSEKQLASGSEEP